MASTVVKERFRRTQFPGEREAKMRKLIALLLTTLLTAAAACNGGVGNRSSGTPNPPFKGEPPQEPYVYKGPTGVYGGQLVLALPDEVGTFNIIRATDQASADVTWVHIFRCLVDYRNGGDPPDYDAGLCTKWENSPDAKQWTFYLRKGVRWSDGEPFTADDVLFTYDVVLDEAVDTPIRSFFVEGRENGKEIYAGLEKLDDYTVRSICTRPTPLSICSTCFIPKVKWRRRGGGKFKT
jgi:ABC-type transport system substrate-binding protein